MGPGAFASVARTRDSLPLLHSCIWQRNEAVQVGVSGGIAVVVLDDHLLSARFVAVLAGHNAVGGALHQGVNGHGVVDTIVKRELSGLRMGTHTIPRRHTALNRRQDA